jgi:recombination protein RecT
MVKNSGELRDKLTKKVESGKVAKSAEGTIYSYLEKMKPQIEKALPKHMTADRLARVMFTVIRTNPKLLGCSMPSLLGCFMQAAQLGVEPGLIGHCYVIPYGTEATFILGYRGMIDLARRSGHIQSIYAEVVKEKDDFEYRLGLNPDLIHNPALTDRGKVIGAYGVARFKDGGFQLEFMPLEEIEKRRSRSKAKNNGPWVTDFDEMAKKTVIRNMFKYLPISIEIMAHVEKDESVARVKDNDCENDDELIEVEYNVYDVNEEMAKHEEKELAKEKEKEKGDVKPGKDKKGKDDEGIFDGEDK